MVEPTESDDTRAAAEYWSAVLPFVERPNEVREHVVSYRATGIFVSSVPKGDVVLF